jgi:spermidine synthase
VLIGGLGMGFTLRAALDSVPATGASVVVAELVPAVVTWNRGPLAPLTNNAVGDPRVTIREEDVGAVMLDGRGRYDAILIDVDNGPDGLHSVNDRLYNSTGLAIAYSALRPGGVYAVWSASGDPGFRRRLHQTGFSVAEHTIHAHGTKGPRHTVWVATRGSR